MDNLFLAAFAHIDVPPDINEREAINANEVRAMEELETERLRNLDDPGNISDGLPGDRTQENRQRNMWMERQPTRPVNPNPITYQQMVEGVVDQGVGSKYVNEILLLMDWAFLNQRNWLCEEILNEYPTINRQMVDENYTQSRRRIKEHYTTLLRNAKNVPVFALENITVQRFMEYLASQAHYITGKVLKSGSYGTKRSAFRHMFRLHNGKGFATEFDSEMSLAWRGFMRTMAKQNVQRLPRAQRQAAQNDENDDESGSSDNDDDDRDEFKEGKDPMSPELFRSICKWAIERGTLEGIFLACFIVWTWNLCCRGHNTA